MVLIRDQRSWVRTNITDGLFGLLLSIVTLLHRLVHLSGQHRQVSLQLLLLVHEARVLKQEVIKLSVMMKCSYFNMIVFDVP